MGTGEVNAERLEKLVEDVNSSGGSEMSNYQLFVERLTGALGLPQPEFAREETRFNDYVFERNVTGGYAPHLNASIKRFNGGLFKNSRALALDQDDIIELHNAAKRGWARSSRRSSAPCSKARWTRPNAPNSAHTTPRAPMSNG